MFIEFRAFPHSTSVRFSGSPRRAITIGAAIATMFPREQLLLEARWVLRDFAEISCD